MWLKNIFVNTFQRYEAQMEKDWLYILNDCDAKLLVVATEVIYEKVKDYIGKVTK